MYNYYVIIWMVFMRPWMTAPYNDTFPTMAREKAIFMQVLYVQTLEF